LLNGNDRFGKQIIEASGTLKGFAPKQPDRSSFGLAAHCLPLTQHAAASGGRFWG